VIAIVLILSGTAFIFYWWRKEWTRLIGYRPRRK